MKIISFTVYELLNGAHINYYRNLLKQARKCEAIVENARQELEAVEAAFNKEDEIMLRSRKNLLTDDIEAQDSLRDRLWSLINYVTKTSRELPDSTISRAAKELCYVMKEYGNLPTMQYDRETGMMYNLCQDLQEKYSEQVEALKLTETVESMRLANEAFNDLLNERTESIQGFVKNELAAARKNTDNAYYQFVEVVNSLSILEERRVGALANAYRNFIEWLNAEIDRLKQQALKTRVRNESAEPTTPDQPGFENPGDGTDPDYPTNPTPTPDPDPEPDPNPTPDPDPDPNPTPDPDPNPGDSNNPGSPSTPNTPNTPTPDPDPDPDEDPGEGDGDDDAGFGR